MRQALLVFVASAAIDLVWTRCVRATVERQRGQAALWAVALYVLSTYATISVVDDHWLVLPAGLGAFIGTWLAVGKA